MVTTRTTTLLLSLLAAVIATALALVLAAQTPAAMNSQKLGRNVCLTTGGARYVPIPGFPGERIDRRLLGDIRLLQRRYKIFITDGYSNDPVHASNGEHPIGLALDIVPDVAAGGTWRDITALARWAEPSQDHPIAPFRWVGYDGDSGHGRGHHLHLSWNHSETKPGVRAASVYTLRCPSGEAPPAADPPAKGSGDSGKGDGGGAHGGKRGSGKGHGGKDRPASTSGGVDPGEGGGPDNSGGITTGRISVGGVSPALGAPVVETGGVDGR